jgi:hypothetical protein
MGEGQQHGCEDDSEGTPLILGNICTERIFTSGHGRHSKIDWCNDNIKTAYGYHADPSDEHGDFLTKEEVTP